ncbi:MAG: enolase C-terminal domain-like protein, partial [bacterium]
MEPTRRSFLKSAALTGGASTALLSNFCSNSPDRGQKTDYAIFDEIIQQPVLKRELFPQPVIISSLELLRDRNNCICRVRSKEGVEGVSIGHPFIAKSSWPTFPHNLHHHFAGKDARDLDELIFNAYEYNIKCQGVPLCVQIASIEFAILDMLGNIANKPAGQLIGDLVHPEVSVYLGTRLEELRTKDPEESLSLVEQDQEETGARAIKIRAGAGDNLGRNNENAPGRTERLIRLTREVFGEDMVLMIDGNGTYDAREAIRLGKIL